MFVSVLTIQFTISCFFSEFYLVHETCFSSLGYQTSQLTLHCQLYECHKSTYCTKLSLKKLNSGHWLQFLQHLKCMTTL